LPRQARLDVPGSLHHIIVRGIERRRIVDDDKDRDDFVNRLGEIASDTDTIIYAWSLLTNHAHFLLRSSEIGISRYMRRVPTGYAIRYNKRHRRHGLFQNRYKSIICDEETYFLELVRYIHLNPLRAGLVSDLVGLEHYRWCGHGVILNRSKQEWQDCDYVPALFGKMKKSARAAYREFVSEGVRQGRRPELVGGGLVRSVGGWFEVKALRKTGERELADERILGSGDFVERIIKESSGHVRRRFPDFERGEQIAQLVKEYCGEEKVNVKELQSGSRRQPVAQIRKRLIRLLVEEEGVTLAEAARQLGVSTSAVSKSLGRKLGESHASQ